MCPRSTIGRQTVSACIAAKLARCGIASEALRRNLRLSSVLHMPFSHSPFSPSFCGTSAQTHSRIESVQTWRAPNPPTSDYWGRTGVASNRLLTPVTQDCEGLQGALSATRGLAPEGVRHSPVNHVHVQTKGVYKIFGVPETSDFTKIWVRTKFCSFSFTKSGSEKGVFWKRGLFREVHFPEILENLEILEILENPQNVENKGESDHFLETREIPPVKRPLS